MLRKLGRWFLGLEEWTPPPTGPDPVRRAELRAAGLPPHWRAIVEAELPPFRRLTADQRAKLLGDAAVFLGEKEVQGLDGFVVDDRARVLVAACAALLVLGLDIARLDHVVRIQIYPVAEVEDGRRIAGRYRSRTGDELRGVVELSWNNVVRGLRRADGDNVALHELAHAFDHADGALDGLMADPRYTAWRDRLALLRLGDVEGPELFAVATEVFFECPHALRRHDATLFETLREIYAIDPRTFSED